MKEFLVTDLLDIKTYKNLNPKKYLEIPVFNKKFKLEDNIIYNKKWNNHQLKLKDIKKNISLYNYYLNELSSYLNKYHNKKFSKRYWRIILGPWLYWFISSVTSKWELIDSLKSNKFIFIKKKLNKKDIIPHGFEDFRKLSRSHYWNHFIFTKIIEFGFSKKIQIKNGRKILENEERKKIYNGLTAQPFKEKISLVIQKVLNFIPQNKKNLIFSTYMSNFQEVLLNLLTNKSLLYYKMLRPNILFKKKKIYQFDRGNLKKLKKTKKKT